MKPKFLLFVVIVAAFVAYQRMPGLKAKAENLANKYGGWNQEAIKDDPVAFIKYAQTQLAGNIAAFEQSRKDLGASKSMAEQKLTLFTDKLTNADNYAQAIKAKYLEAEASGAFPFTVLNASYTKEQAIKQVEELLAEKANSSARIADYQGILAKVETKRTELGDRINQSKAKLDELEAQATMVDIDLKTGKADALLAQVNAIVEENGKLAKGEESSPVRSVDELMAEFDKSAEAAPKAAPKADALAFLTK